ncbi:MAG: hypothetical protein HY048_12675 [Acidobacteria bacterium]|nr:hypothetical protein [Acidobacteriota bacterium]
MKRDEHGRADTVSPIPVLLENHHAFLRYLERRAGDRALAEDILQDAFVKIVARPDRAPADEAIVPWFYRTLRNAAIDQFRRRDAAGRAVEAFAHELEAAVDVVGPFLLTALLRERLATCGGRVITLTGIYQRKGRVDTSDLHFARRPYGWLAANNQAQQGRLLFTVELARKAPRLMTAAVHPGAVLTGAQARLPFAARAVIVTLARPAFVRPEVGAILCCGWPRTPIFKA